MYKKRMSRSRYCIELVVHINCPYFPLLLVGFGFVYLIVLNSLCIIYSGCCCWLVPPKELQNRATELQFAVLGESFASGVSWLVNKQYGVPDPQPLPTL